MNDAAPPGAGAPSSDPALRSSADVAEGLGTNLATGLSTAQAARRLAADGPNSLRGAASIAGWRRFLAEFRDPLIYLLLGAIGISLAAWAFDGFAGWPVDAIVIAVIVLLNGLLGHVQQGKARNAVAALARLSAASSTVLRDGRRQRVPAATLVCGDLLMLEEGDAVAADARLVNAAVLRLHEASLTGESEAVLKNPATLPEPAALGDRLNMVFRGTSVVQGSGLAVVTATGMATQMGRIAGLLESAVQTRTPLQEEIAHVGRMLGAAVLLIALLVVTTILWMYEPRSAEGIVAVLLLGVALAVAAVPEGLPAILSVVLALGVQRMARHHAIVRDLSSVETLGSASVICTDKTGTLTRAEMTIERVVTVSGSSVVTGVGYAPKGQVCHDNRKLEAGPLYAEHIAVLSGGSLAGNAELRQSPGGNWEIQGDPTEAAFLVAEQKLGVHQRRTRRFQRIAQVPFTSERKMMSTLEIDHEHGDQVVLITKGAPDVLLARCTHARRGTAVIDLDDALRAKILADVDALSDAALRTLAVAYRPLLAGEKAGPEEALEHGLVFVGTVGIIDPPRKEAALAIAEARRAGIRVVMITGDHPRTALRIASDLGIVAGGAQAMTGVELDRLDDAALADAARTTSVYARVAPAHKLRIVKSLQAGGNIVAMTGDGVNDAPALKFADIGIAMGITGTEVTRQAAKMVLADDNFATIVQAVREGRGIFDNIRKFLRYLLSSNMGEVLTVFFGVVAAGVIGLKDPSGAVVLPLLATQILWLNLITDSWPALAMGMDPTAEDVMARKPRLRSERVIDAAMWSGIFQTGVVVAAASLLTLDIYLPGGLVEGTHELGNARTAGFTTLVFAHLFNCFNARSETASAFRQPFANPWLWAALALSLLLQVAVVHLAVLNLAFGTTPLSPGQWLVCAAMGSAVLWASELRKLVNRHLGLIHVRAFATSRR